MSYLRLWGNDGNAAHRWGAYGGVVVVCAHQLLPRIFLVFCPLAELHRKMLKCSVLLCPPTASWWGDFLENGAWAVPSGRIINWWRPWKCTAKRGQLSTSWICLSAWKSGVNPAGLVACVHQEACAAGFYGDVWPWACLCCCRTSVSNPCANNL